MNAHSRSEVSSATRMHENVCCEIPRVSSSFHFGWLWFTEIHIQPFSSPYLESIHPSSYMGRSKEKSKLAGIVKARNNDICREMLTHSLLPTRIWMKRLKQHGGGREITHRRPAVSWGTVLADMPAVVWKIQPISFNHAEDEVKLSCQTVPLDSECTLPK